MPKFIFTNNVDTTLAGAISPSATSLALSSATHLPNSIPAGQVLVITLNDQATRQNFEIIYATEVSGATLSGLSRGQEGTAALAWSVGDFAWSGPTAGQMANFQPGRLLNVQYITATSTYTPTPGTANAIVEGAGGGGAGAGFPNPGSGSAAAGGGGAAGAFGKMVLSNPVATSVVIGAGGNGVSGTAGTNGGTTSFGSLLVLPGGGGAPLANIASIASFTGVDGQPSAPPTVVGGIGSVGYQGQQGMILSASSGQGGAGGNSPYGSGGLIASTNTIGSAFPGNSANGFGAGGGGAVGLGNSATEAGGNGTPGIIIVWEYT
ncbi:hypothetical protein [Paraburkholderia sp. BL21I4N1]|uniref:glycine-rich domain-containing protein n=1 Tax=Paraburkholderia sp. BL21I4N1 TaxID=1938801 RepID=UPI000D4601C4|nr:hypothetical protein [Paraburkholderia sp. BL21I4N1]PQV51803.1 hypothetical protein B0G83_10410 [Paraburkholderia sp. BL21I4N1]